jgi:murein DD-endopeptidase MepM/ murein hydrolase activator NlpD
MNKMAVEEGDKVNRGDIIGYVGNTGLSAGPHCHYEVRKND